MRKNQTGPKFVYLGEQKIGYRRREVDKWLDANSVPTI
jgi:predicted DNA-binding transcriptional regulator AlpA